MLSVEMTRAQVAELAAEYGLVARILSAGEFWSAEITGPAGRTSDGGGLIAMYSSWTGEFVSGNGVALESHDVRGYLRREHA